MKSIFALIILFNISFSASKQTLRTINTEILSLFKDNRIEEVLPVVQNKLIGINQNPDDNSAYLKLFLKVWEIKGHFYLGQIDSCLIKYENLKKRVNDETDNYNSLLFEVPFKNYVDKIKTGKEINCITEKLTKQMKTFWNLEILNESRFSEHYANLNIKVGKFDIDLEKLLPDSHTEKARIIDKDENTVQYSLFPSFIPQKNLSLDDFSNFEKIVSYEFEMSKRSRFEILQNQKREPLEFKNEIIEINTNMKSYSCLINAVPIYRESKIEKTDVMETGYYKLYIHDNHSKNVNRYSFREKSLLGGNNNLLLINWNQNWDMQELYDENLITISVPSSISNLIEISVGNDKMLPLTSFQKGASISQNIQIDSSTEDIRDPKKWKLDREEGEVFGSSKQCNVQKIEIDVSKNPNKINIKIKEANEKEKKINERIFFGILFTSLYFLFN